MKDFALVTWSGDRLVGYEPLTSDSLDGAISFAHGLLSERTRGHAQWLVKMGVHYVLDHGHHDPEMLIMGPRTPVGTWHLTDVDGAARLRWEYQPTDS